MVERIERPSVRHTIRILSLSGRMFTLHLLLFYHESSFFCFCVGFFRNTSL